MIVSGNLVPDKFRCVAQGAQTGNRRYENVDTKEVSPILQNGEELNKWIADSNWTPELEAFDANI